MSRLGTLVVELAAEIRKYMADMNTAAATTEATTARMGKAQGELAQTSDAAAQAQDQLAQTAVQAAARMGPMGGAVAAAAAVVAGYGLVSYKAAQENTALVRAMALSGNQAGVTAGQLQRMAAGASDVVGTHSQAAQAIGEMVASGKVAGQNLQALTVTALNAQRTLGVSVQDTVKAYEQLGDAPTKASQKLNEQLGYLNAETYRRIAALEDMGRKDEAAALAQLTYAKGVDDATRKVEASLGTLQKAWRSVGEAAGKAWDWMLGLGRKDEVQDQMAKLRQQLEEKQSQLAAGSGLTMQVSSNGLRRMVPISREQLQMEAEALREQIGLLGRAGATAAMNAANSVKYQQESIEWANKARDAQEQLKTTAQKRADAIEAADKALRDGHISAQEHATLVAAAEQKYADKVRQSKQAVDEFAQALERVQGKEAGLNGDYDKTLAALYQGYVQGRIGAEDYAKAVEALIKQQPFYKAGLEAQAKAEKALVQAEVEAARARNAAFDEYFDQQEQERLRNEGRIKTAREMLEQIQFETELLGMNAEQRAVATAMRELERQGVVKGTQAWEAYADAIRKAVENREAQTQAIGFWNSIENTAHQVWTSVTEGGQNAFERIGKTLKAAVLDLLWQMTARKWLIQLGVSLGVPGAAQAAAQAGGAADWFGSLGSIASSLGALGSGLQAGFGALLNGGLFEAVSTGVTAAFTGGTLGSVFAGIGTALGALGPIAAILGIIASLDDSGTMHTGGLGSYSEAGGSATGDAVKAQSPGFFNLNSADYQTSTANASANLARSLVGLLDSTARTFGRTAGYYVATAFADDTSADGAWGSLLIKIGDRIIADWGPGGDNVLGREFADGEEGAREYALAVAKDMRDYLVTETPGWADEMLNALGEAPTLEDLAATVAAINAAAQVFETFGSVAANFGAIGEEAMDALVKAMGGAQAAAQQLSAYYQAYYTDAERRAVVQRQVEAQMTALGLTNLPKTRAEFRALVESLDLSTEAGRKMYAALMALAPAFASYTEEMVDAAAQAAQRVATIASEIAAAVEKAQQEARQAAQEQLATARANLQAAVAREKAIIQERIANWQTIAQEAQAVFDTLASGIRSLQEDALGPEQSAQQAQAYIAQALEAARATGSLPDAEELSAAIAAAQQGMTAQVYGSEAERRYAQLKLAGELKALQEISGDQLSEAERQIELEEGQLEALDDLLAYWNGYGQKGIDATLSVADAVTAMQVAVNNTLEEGFGSISGLGGKTLLEQLTRVASQYSAATTAESLQQLTQSVMAGTIDLNSAVNLLAGTPTTSPRFHEEVEVLKRHTAESYYALIRENIDQLINGGMTAQQLALTMIEAGVSLTDAAHAYGVTAADIAANLLKNGATTLPQLAVGTNFVPQDMLALIHQGEAVVPKAFNPWAGGGMSMPSLQTDNRSLERWLAALDSRFARIELQLAVAGTAAQETAGVLRRVTAGPALRTEAL